MTTHPKLNTIPELLEDIRAGRLVVLMDDEDRENEGDLIMAASKVRPEDINFMARFGRGQPASDAAFRRRPKTDQPDEDIGANKKQSADEQVTGTLRGMTPACRSWRRTGSTATARPAATARTTTDWRCSAPGTEPSGDGGPVSAPGRRPAP